METESFNPYEHNDPNPCLYRYFIIIFLFKAISRLLDDFPFKAFVLKLF